MKKKVRILSLFLTALMVISLSACGSKDNSVEDSTQQNNTVESDQRNNVDTGEASVVIRGKGTMGGVKTLKFKIVQKPVNWNGAYTDGKFSR